MSIESICLSHTVRSHGKPKPSTYKHYKRQRAEILRKFCQFGLWLLTALLLLSPHTAHAANGGGGLPWEAPLTTLSNSVTGNVAYAVSLLGIVGAGGILIFAGGQVNEFIRAVLFCVLVISFIIAAKNTLTAFGFAAGAEITQSQPVNGAVLRRVTLHRAGIRPHLFLGGDRELVLFSGLIASVLIFSCLQPLTIVAGVTLWLAALWVFRRLAKADPLMRFIYLRQLLYRKYYPARSTPFHENKRLQLSAYK